MGRTPARPLPTLVAHRSRRRRATRPTLHYRRRGAWPSCSLVGGLTLPVHLHIRAVILHVHDLARRQAKRQERPAKPSSPALRLAGSPPSSSPARSARRLGRLLAIAGDMMTALGCNRRGHSTSLAISSPAPRSLLMLRSKAELALIRIGSNRRMKQAWKGERE